MAHPIGLAHLSAIELEPTALLDLAAETGHASVALRLHSAAADTPFYPMVPGTVGHGHCVIMPIHGASPSVK